MGNIKRKALRRIMKKITSRPFSKKPARLIINRYHKQIYMATVKKRFHNREYLDLTKILTEEV